MLDFFSAENGLDYLELTEPDDEPVARLDFSNRVLSIRTRPALDEFSLTS